MVRDKLELYTTRKYMQFSQRTKTLRVENKTQNLRVSKGVL